MNRSMHGLLVIVFLVGIPAALAAQSDAASQHAFEKYPNALGFTAGNMIGPGLTWLHWPDRTGFQIAGGILYFPPDSDTWLYNDTTLDYNIGGQVLYKMFGDTYTNWLTGLLYVWGSMRHRGYIPVEWDDDSGSGQDESDYTVGDYTPTIGSGVGIGIEVIIFNHFSIPFEFGYVAEAEFPRSDDILFTIDLAFQSGFRYRY